MRARGILLVAIASILWSTAGLFVRLLDLDLPTIMVWRSLAAACSLALIFVWRRGRGWLPALRQVGVPSLLAVPVSAVSMLAFLAALKLTTVANVMTIYATLPFVAAGIAFLWMRERLKPRVLLASGCALVGVIIIAGAATRPEDWGGNASALLMTVTFAVLLVMARRYPQLDMAPVNCAAALLCAAACWPLADHGWPGAYDFALVCIFGIATTSLAYLLFLTGGRYLPSAEAGLIGFLDVVLGPLWVWMAFGEKPSTAGLIGAGFVLASVFGYLVGEWLQARREIATEVTDGVVRRA
jgi:drug/metabolite transporter (DMT)-like permease